MAKVQDRSKRKLSGSRYVALKKKKQYELGRQPTLTKVGETKSKKIRTMSGRRKEILLTGDLLNLYNPKTKKYSKEKINTVIENQANRHYVRRNILTKGSIVETSQGKAKLTSRPGQEGTLNAVLIE
ncbi:30S ribosomal protein S8e [archaeon]|jgi:small subunit ribosomal protein S8e|nr:30S ribosomal protein S8e [archaeon]